MAMPFNDNVSGCAEGKLSPSSMVVVWWRQDIEDGSCVDLYTIRATWHCGADPMAVAPWLCAESGRMLSACAHRLKLMYVAGGGVELERCAWGSHHSLGCRSAEELRTRRREQSRAWGRSCSE